MHSSDQVHMCAGQVQQAMQDLTVLQQEVLSAFEQVLQHKEAGREDDIVTAELTLKRYENLRCVSHHQLNVVMYT